MEDRQFDAWSKTLARRESRRQALKAGGAGAALLGILGLRGSRQAIAQDNDVSSGDQTATVDASSPSAQTGLANDGTCTMQFEADVRVGPSAASVNTSNLVGKLSFKPGDNGGISSGTLTLGDGTVYPVVGQASGRSISLRIQLSDKTLIAVGVGDHNVRSCQGLYGGPATGPVRGDLGDWIATAEGKPDATATAAASATTASGSSQSQPTQSSGDGSATAAPTNPPCDLTCTDPLVVDPATCTCICPNSMVVCGAVCCPIGSVCNDASSGNCSCASGSALCGGACVSCPSGQVLDFNSCGCVDNPCPGGGELCGTTCVDTVNDRNNCGSCGNVCGTGVPCIAGSCSCPPGYSTCADGCKDLASDNANCGTCGNVCGTGTSCQAGKCF